MSKSPLNVSTSGGRSSMFMARLIQQSESYTVQYEPHYLFCNTGKECNETLDFIHEAQDRWNLPVVWLEAVVHEGRISCTHRIVSYETASRNGEPFDAVIAKYGLPNKSYRHCTREMKQHVMASYMRSIGHQSWTSAIGFRFDEPQRMTGKTKWGPAIYPLYDLCLRRQEIRLWWKDQPFDLGIEDYQGNCDLCFMKSLEKRVRIVQDQPERLDWWQRHEEASSDRILDIREVVRMSELREIAAKKRAMPEGFDQTSLPCMCFED